MTIDFKHADAETMDATIATEHADKVTPLLELIGSHVTVVQPARTSASSDGGGDIDCFVRDLDPTWPLRLTGGWTLCQCFHYDLRSWYWVLERNGEVIAIDTSDDPDGLGKYGMSTSPLTTEETGRSGGAIRAAYLSAKRIGKGSSDVREWTRIADMVGDDPARYEAALGDIFGEHFGQTLARKVMQRDVPDAETVGRAQAQQRRHRFRTLTRSARIAAGETQRTVKRLARPTGLIVLVGGPDGVGKSTLVNGLVDATEGLFRRYMRVHWSPGILPRPGALVGRTASDVSTPHAAEPHGLATSMPLLAYHFVDQALGGWLRVWPSRARSGLVIIERGWWDAAVDPRRYGLRIPSTLVRLLGAFLPKPDVAVVLDAPARIVRDRKRELSETEIARQTNVWRNVLPSRTRTLHVDASASRDEVMDRVRSSIVTVLENRAIKRLGSGWVGLPTSKAPRWILPRGPRKLATQALSLYQPVTRKGLVGWRFARLVAAAGGFRLAPRADAPPEDVRAALAPFLPRGSTFALAHTQHPGRYHAMVLNSDGAPHSFAKIAIDPKDREALAKEADGLRSLSRFLPAPVSAPHILEQSDAVLLLSPIDWRVDTRPWRLHPRVATAMGAFFLAGREGGEARGFGHGDFAPWNLLSTSKGWVLLDWESAERSADPFADILHFLVQANALIGKPNAHEIMLGVTGEGWIADVIRAYAFAADLPLSPLASHFRGYLESSMAMIDPSTPHAEAGLTARRRLLRQLRS